MLDSDKKTADGDWPALRDDLDITRGKEGEGAYLVTDERSGELFEFGEEDYFLLRCLDGRSGAEQTRQRFEERFGKRIDRSRLDQFIAMVDEWGLLKRARPRRRPRAADYGEELQDVDVDIDPDAVVPLHRRRQLRARAMRAGGAAAAGGPAAGAGAAAGAGGGGAAAGGAGGGGAAAGGGPAFAAGGGAGAPPEWDDAGDADFAPRGFWKEFEDDQREIHFPLFRPDGICRAIVTILRPFSFLFLLLPILCGIGIATVANNFPEYVADVARYRAPVPLAVRLLFSFVTVNLASEFARGIVAVHFGGEARKIGIRLVLGVIPRFHLAIDRIADMSRREILWIYSAPLLMRLVLGAAGALVWWFTRGAGNDIPALAIMLSVVATISMLINANPLARRNDGYHLFAAILWMPDLRRRATRTLLAYFRKGDRIADTDEQRGLRAYAVASLIYILVIVAVFVAVSAYWLEYTYQGTGVVLFLLLLAYLVWHLRSQARMQRAVNEAQREERRQQAMAERAAQMPGGPRFGLGRMGGARPAAAGAGGGSGGGGGMPGMPALRTGPPAMSVKTEREEKKKRSNPVIGILLLIVIAVIMMLPYQYKAGGPVTVLPAQQREIHAEIAGPVEEILVESGKFVPEGAVIARQSAAEEERNLQSTRAAIAEQEAVLAELLAGARPEDVELARKELDTARVQARFSEGEAKRAADLYETGVIPLDELEDAQRRAEVDRAEITEAEAKLTRAAKGAHPKEIEAVEARLEGLRQTLAYHQAQVERTVLRMPFAGRVVTSNLQDLEGRFLDKGDKFVVVENADTVRIEFTIPQSETREIRIGAPAEAKFWAYPERTFRGEVVDISAAVEATGEQGKVVRVTTVIDNADGLLKSGMTGFGKVKGEERTVFEAFSGALRRFFLVEVWGWLP